MGQAIGGEIEKDCVVNEGRRSSGKKEWHE